MIEKRMMHIGRFENKKGPPVEGDPHFKKTKTQLIFQWMPVPLPIALSEP